MKKLILVASILVSSLAHAGGTVLMTMPNDAGGQMELTNLQCKTGNGWVSHTWGNGVPDAWGCWTVNDQQKTIMIFYRDANRTYTLPWSNFKLTAEGNNESLWHAVSY